MAEPVRAVPVSSVAHPLVDQVGHSSGRAWSLTETRARVVLLDGWRLDLLRRVGGTDREIILATDERSSLTPALAQVWAEAGGRWLVRDPEAGLRDGFSGRGLTRLDDLWTPTSTGSGLPTSQVAARHVESGWNDAVELSGVLVVRLPARGATVLGRAIAELAAAVGTAPAAWGSREPVLRAWEPAALTAAVRARMPGPVQLVVRGVRLAALVRVRRTRHGLEETTHFTLAAAGGDDDLRAEATARAAAALSRLAGDAMPLVSVVFARDGRQDLLRRPVVQSPASPVMLLLGAPVVRALNLDPAAAVADGAQLVGRRKLPGLTYPFSAAVADVTTSWSALEHVLRGFDPAADGDIFATAMTAFDQHKPTLDPRG